MLLECQAQREPSEQTAEDPELVQLLDLYVERFNRHDWDGLRELISADAGLEVVDRFRGSLDESGYFGVYERWSSPGRWLWV